MNRFAHDNIDPSISIQKRLQVMTPTIGPSAVKGKRPSGYDRFVGERLKRRRRTFDAMDAPAQAGRTRPGSLNHKKVG